MNKLTKQLIIHKNCLSDMLHDNRVDRHDKSIAQDYITKIDNCLYFMVIGNSEVMNHYKPVIKHNSLYFQDFDLTCFVRNNSNYISSPTYTNNKILTGVK